MTGTLSGVGVVTIVHGRHDHLLGQLRALDLGVRAPALHVVVAMDDPQIRHLVRSRPDRVVVDVARDAQGLPLAAARNRGCAAAIEAGCDVVIGLDVDCLPGPDLVLGYAGAVRDAPDVVWSGPVTYLPPAGADGYPFGDLPALDAPHPARPAPAPGERVRGADPDLFWSLSFALSTEMWSTIGGFDERYVGYGGEDTDFARRIHRAGLDLGWVGSARAYHQHHPVTRPPVEHLDDIVRNAGLFHERWGSWPMEGWLSAFEERGLVRRTPEGWVRADAPAPQ